MVIRFVGTNGTKIWITQRKTHRVIFKVNYSQKIGFRSSTDDEIFIYESSTI